MFKKDFLIRQFEEFGKVLAKIIGLKKEKDWESVEKEIASAINNFTGMELARLEQMNVSAFGQFVLADNKLSSDQIKILARLMFERLELFLAEKDEAMISAQRDKCLLLYEQALKNLTQNEFDLDIYYKIEFLKNC